jgi:hypothetical protein
MKKSLLLGLAAAAVSTVAVAQDLSAPATYGTVTLETGFSPDPTTVAVQAGGTLAAPGGCVGKVANAPDFELTYTAGTTFPLNIYVKSDSDTTLAINGPDGSWYCADDSNGVNPAVTFTTPASGVYDVFVGTYGDTPAPATLHVSELAPQW